MKTKEEIEIKIKEFEAKLLDTNDFRAKDIIKTKIYSLKWVIGDLN